MQVTSIIISILALAISGLTAWLTLLKRGNVKMTRPSVIYFGPDGGTREVEHPKVFLRALLFSTSKKGRVIEAMFVTLRRSETRQNFNIWVHGGDRLDRGGGLFVGEEGVLSSHHFLLPRDSNSFVFSEGRYLLEVYAQVVGDKSTSKLFSQELEIDRAVALAMKSHAHGVYFDWGPDAARYSANVEALRPQRPQKHAPYDIDWERPS